MAHAVEELRIAAPRAGLTAALSVLVAASTWGQEPAKGWSAAAAPVPEMPDEALLFASPTTHDHVGRVVVPVMINGQGPFRFVVDTGANHSTISPELVSTLGLKLGGTRTVVLDGITGTAEVPYVIVDRLQAGELIFNNAPLPIVSAPVLAGADGILGAAGLTEKSLLVDFQRNRVAISHGIEGALRAEATKIHAARVDHGLITLDALVGRVKVRAVVDTGSERTLGNPALRAALRRAPQRGAVVQVTSVYGATEQVERGVIQIAPPISIDSIHITEVPVVYGDFHIFKVWELEGTPALIIGMDVLGTVASLGIDFKHQDVYVASFKAGTTFTFNSSSLSNQLQKR